MLEQVVVTLVQKLKISVSRLDLFPRLNLKLFKRSVRNLCESS